MVTRMLLLYTLFNSINYFLGGLYKMGTLEIVFGVILLVFSIAIILVVLLQEGHQKNVGIVTGGADTFLSKNKARSVDAFLARWTKFIAVGFFVLVIAMNIVMYFT
jgi:protein translocase, SecG subunit